MKVGLIGLGKMGSQIAKKLQASDFEVHGTDVSEDNRNQLSKDITVHESRSTLVDALGENPVVWVMIPHEFVEEEISKLLDILPAGSTIIEGGNTPFEQAKSQSAMAREKSIALLDAGVSGGVAGFEDGFSIMVGGDPEAFSKVEQIFNVLTAPGGYGHVGPSGAGHFVKMIHNGIEYGMMEAYAEGFEVIRNSEYSHTDLSKLTSIWQNGAIIRSYLNELAIDIFAQNPDLDGIDGKVNSLGEADWTREYAQKIGINVPVIDQAIKRRDDSRNGDVSYATKFLAALRNAFGGHSLNKTNEDRESGSKSNV